MPELHSPNSDSVLSFNSGANKYRFVGIHFTGISRYNLIKLGDDADSGANASTLSQFPNEIVFDRVYAHGKKTSDLRRVFMANARAFALIDSYVSDAHEVCADSQALAAWDGPGPYKIVNCYLEGAGENVLFGGADSVSIETHPADLEFRGNYVS